MLALLQTPSAIAFMATIVVVSGVFALRSPARMTDVAIDAGAVASLVYLVIDTVLRGLSMATLLWFAALLMWLVGLFVVCVPLTFLAGLAWRAVMRRPLNAFRDPSDTVASQQ